MWGLKGVVVIPANPPHCVQVTPLSKQRLPFFPQLLELFALFRHGRGGRVVLGVAVEVRCMPGDTAAGAVQTDWAYYPAGAGKACTWMDSGEQKY